MDSDSVFAGPVPELYDRYLGPILFQPFAELVAERLAEGDREILEIAAGTGIVTRAIAAAWPASRITATDLNQAMLDVAAAKQGAGVTWLRADAQALPFDADAFDVVVCGFGLMFVPDKTLACREVRRVLRPGGRFLCTVWDRIEANPLQHVAELAVGALYPEDPPLFLSRMPYGYHDPARIEADLRAAGFDTVAIEPLAPESGEATALQAATGSCQGTPLRAEIEARDPDGLARATEASAAALRAHFGADRFRAPMRALLVSAA